MSKYNLSDFKKYKNGFAVIVALCDIGNDNCLAKDKPNSVKVYFVIDKENNEQQLNVCNNCSTELLKLELQ